MKPLILLVPAVIALSACGRGDQGPAAPAPKAAPVLSDADKAALLATLPAPYDQGDLANGRRVFARCRACHTIGEGGPDLAGPNLYGVFGRKAGDLPRYNYSNVMRDAGFTWDAAHLDQWLAGPKAFMPGNKMTFAGLPKAQDRRDVIAFLKVETGYTPPPAPAAGHSAGAGAGAPD